jgi:glycine cleavage system pyridoxal-binding protein P
VQSVLSFFSVVTSLVGLELIVSSIAGEGVGVAVGAAVSVAIVLERDKKVHGSWEVSKDMYDQYIASVK